MEAEDVAQDLATHVFQQTHRARSGKEKRAHFVAKVVKNKALNLIEAQRAKKRDDRRNIDYEDAPDGALIDGSRNEAQVDLQLEMRELAKSLPLDQREVYSLMVQGYGEADIHKHLQISRQRARTLMKKVENGIREAKLGRYVGGQPEDD
jgi:DNA-directed RNA polymerase specialized sigma24 family protein